MTEVVVLPADYGTREVFNSAHEMVGVLHPCTDGEILASAATPGPVGGERILLAWHRTEPEAVAWVLCVHTGGRS